MKAGRKRQTITEKEAVLMNMLWNGGTAIRQRDA